MPWEKDHSGAGANWFLSSVAHSLTVLGELSERISNELCEISLGLLFVLWIYYTYLSKS